MDRTVYPHGSGVRQRQARRCVAGTPAAGTLAEMTHRAQSGSRFAAALPSRPVSRLGDGPGENGAKLGVEMEEYISPKFMPHKLLTVMGTVVAAADGRNQEGAVAIRTADGRQFVVTARPAVRKLLRHVGEEVEATGVLTEGEHGARVFVLEDFEEPGRGTPGNMDDREVHWEGDAPDWRARRKAKAGRRQEHKRRVSRRQAEWEE